MLIVLGALPFVWMKTQFPESCIPGDSAKLNLLCSYTGLFVASISRLSPHRHHGPPGQGLAILGLESRDRDQYYLIVGLVVETETETFLPVVSKSRPRLYFPQSQYRDRYRDFTFLSLNIETETFSASVSISRLRSRLYIFLTYI